MSHSPNLIRRLLLNAFRRSTATIRNHVPSRPLGRQLELLEDRVVPALPVTFTVNAFSLTGGTPTATDNDYTRINNVFQNPALTAGDTIQLNGAFNWGEAKAKASWAKGSDGLTGSGDEYSIFVPPDLNGVTLTTTSGASVTAPGDLTTADTEAFLYFDDSGTNQSWTISNLTLSGFDGAIEMYRNGGLANAYDGTTITNNTITVPADVDNTADPSDNVGIMLGYGQNQHVTNNTIRLAGTGISLTPNFAQSVGIETQAAYGAIYDGLQITGNTIQVTGTQNAKPEIVMGVWENGNAHNSNILISGNSFTNTSVGNDKTKNLERAFRITSQSSAGSTVTYSNNTVSGANIGFQWLPVDYFADYTGTLPVELIGNTITNNNTGIVVQSSGSAYLGKNTITFNNTGVVVGGPGLGGVGISDGSLAAGSHGAAAEFNIISQNGTGISFGGGGSVGHIFSNDLSGNGGDAITNNTATTLDATSNWWGTTDPLAIPNEFTGPVDFSGYLPGTPTPGFVNATSAIFSSNQSNSFTFTTSGFPAPALSIVSGSLPSGVTFLDNGDGTATLSGTPAPSVGGFPLTISADNGFAPVTQSFLLTVVDPPTITSVSSTLFTEGSLGTFTVTTTPGVPSSTALSVVPALPAWLTFVDNLDGTATLSGTPPTGAGGVYPLVITAGNGVNSSVTQNFTLNVQGAPTITSNSAAVFVVGLAGTFTITGTGFPFATYSSDPLTPLPVWLSLTSNGDGTATLSGTPPGGAEGTYPPITITASNGIGTDATQNFTLTVTQPPTITSAASALFSIGSPGTFTVTTGTSFPAGVTLAATLTPSGALPAWLTFTDNLDGTATLSGTPPVGNGGSYDITITASNSLSSATQAFTLNVNGAPTVPATAATFVVGQFGTFTLATTGFPFPAISSSTLPSGLTLADNGDGTATVSGTPLAGTGGTSNVMIFAADNGFGAASGILTLTVNEAPTITSLDHVAFPVNVAISASNPLNHVTTSPGFPVTTATLSISGSLPPGVTFVPATGKFSGKPTVAGVYTFTINASNGTVSSSQLFTLTVTSSLALTTPHTESFVVGQSAPYISVLASGLDSNGNPPTLISTALPAGLSLSTGVNSSGNTVGLISGNPTGPGGSFKVTLTASDGDGHTLSKIITIVVNQAPILSITNNSIPVLSATVTAGTPVATTLPGFLVSKTGFPAPVLLAPTVQLLTPNGLVPAKLPAGVTFSTSTGKFGGTPTATSGGVYVITFSAKNTEATTTQTFTLNVQGPPVIALVAPQPLVLGQSGSLTISGGLPNSTFTTSTNLAGTGLTFVDNLDGTASLTGTPTGSVGNKTISITATNAFGTITKTLSYTVGAAPLFVGPTSATFTHGVVGTSISTITGFPAAKITKTGVPSVLTVTTATNATTGTTTVTVKSKTSTLAGVYTFTITADDGIGGPVSQLYTITVT